MSSYHSLDYVFSLDVGLWIQVLAKERLDCCCYSPHGAMLYLNMVNNALSITLKGTISKAIFPCATAKAPLSHRIFSVKLLSPLSEPLSGEQVPFQNSSLQRTSQPLVAFIQFLVLRSFVEKANLHSGQCIKGKVSFRKSSEPATAQKHMAVTLIFGILKEE